MSWIPSSKGTALVVLIALALATAGTAAAISVSADEVPDESEAGQQTQATVVIEDPFVDMSNNWTLAGSTELVGDSAEWTVTVEQQREEIDEQEYEAGNFSHELSQTNGGDTVVVEVTGETPSIEEYSYDSPQSFVIYDLNAISGNTQEDLEDGERSVHHYTSDSREARQAIEDARETVDESGGSDARSTLNQSINAFESGTFDNAESLASDAADEAEQSQQSQETQQMILYGVGAIVVVALLGGGIYYWRSQQDEYGKLQ